MGNLKPETAAYSELRFPDAVSQTMQEVKICQHSFELVALELNQDFVIPIENKAALWSVNSKLVD